MVTNIRIEMSEEARKVLNKHLTGKSKPATRKQIAYWASSLLTTTLECIVSDETSK